MRRITARDPLARLLLRALPCASLLPLAANGLGLDEAMSRAIASSPLVRAATEKVGESESEISLARSGYYPTVAGIGQQMYTPGADDGSEWDLTAGLSLTQSIYSGGSTRASVNLHSEARNEGKIRVAAITRDLKLKVIESYYRLLLAREIRALSESVRPFYDQVAVVGKRGQRHNLIGPQELELAELRVQQFYAALEEQDATVRLEGLSLGTMLGQGEVEPSQLSESLDANPAPMDELERLSSIAPARDLNLALIRSQGQQIRESRELSLANERPNLRAFATLGTLLESPFSVNRSATVGSRVGLALTVPLFSGFSLSAKRGVFAQRSSQNAFALKHAETEASLLARSRKAQVEILERKRRLIEQQVAVGRETWRRMRKRLGMGLARPTEWLSVLESLTSLEAQRLETQSKRLALGQQIRESVQTGTDEGSSP